MQQIFVNADDIGVFEGLPQLAILDVEWLQTLQVNVFNHVSTGTGNTRDFNDSFDELLRDAVSGSVTTLCACPPYKNLMRLNIKLHCNIPEEDIYKVANSRL